ncbi:MAG: hypothetical protein P1U53_11120 [Sulfitobacter sp.]|nr:hypothetical protein [Sulfitobacter sp.]
MKEWREEIKKAPRGQRKFKQMLDKESEGGNLEQNTLYRLLFVSAALVDLEALMALNEVLQTREKTSKHKDMVRKGLTFAYKYEGNRSIKNDVGGYARIKRWVRAN